MFLTVKSGNRKALPQKPEVLCNLEWHFNGFCQLNGFKMVFKSQTDKNYNIQEGVRSQSPR